MNQSNPTADELSLCMRLLDEAEAPMLAIDIADRLYITGSHETKRRHVRALVQKLRDNGARIVATTADGYFLTEDESLWRDYLEGRQIDAKRILGETYKRKKMLADSQGQGHLFTLPRIQAGCATVGA
jgi:biotin operon repressor